MKTTPNRVWKVLGPVLAVALVLGVLVGVLLGLLAFLRAVSALGSNVTVAIIAGAATAIVSVVSIVVGKTYESSTHIKKEIRDKKVPVYEDLIAFMFRVLTGSKAGPPNEEEVTAFLLGVTPRIVVWGSDGVLVAWMRFRLAMLTAGEEGSDVRVRALLLRFEELLRAIRSDLGHKNQGIARGDILRSFVNDLPPDL